MKAAYEKEELGISLEDFEAPEVVSIPIDCEEAGVNILAPTSTEKEEDLDELGF
jgi:hypothetical protein